MPVTIIESRSVERGIHGAFAEFNYQFSYQVGEAGRKSGSPSNRNTFSNTLIRYAVLVFQAGTDGENQTFKLYS